MKTVILNIDGFKVPGVNRVLKYNEAALLVGDIKLSFKSKIETETENAFTKTSYLRECHVLIDTDKDIYLIYPEKPFKES